MYVIILPRCLKAQSFVNLERFWHRDSSPQHQQRTIERATTEHQRAGFMTP